MDLMMGLLSHHEFKPKNKSIVLRTTASKGLSHQSSFIDNYEEPVVDWMLYSRSQQG